MKCMRPITRIRLSLARILENDAVVVSRNYWRLFTVVKEVLRKGRRDVAEEDEESHHAGTEKKRTWAIINDDITCI